MKQKYTPEKRLTFSEDRLIMAAILEHQRKNKCLTKSQLIALLVKKEIPVLFDCFLDHLKSDYERGHITKEQWLIAKGLKRHGFPSESSLIKRLQRLKDLKMVESLPPGARKWCHLVVTDLGMVAFLKSQNCFLVNRYINDASELMSLNNQLLRYLASKNKEKK